MTFYLSNYSFKIYIKVDHRIISDLHSVLRFLIYGLRISLQSAPWHSHLVKPCALARRKICLDRDPCDDCIVTYMDSVEFLVSAGEYASPMDPIRGILWYVIYLTLQKLNMLKMMLLLQRWDMLVP